MTRSFLSLAPPLAPPLAAAFACLLSAPSVRAAPPAGPGVGHVPGTGPGQATPKPQTSQNAQAASALLEEAPGLPPVSDAMLTPPPPAGRQLQTWDEAIALVRARSTDLHTAVDEVQRAEGQTRIALAALLPSLGGALSANRQLLSQTQTVTDQTGAMRTIDAPNRTLLQAGLSFSQPFNLGSYYAYGTAKANETVVGWNLEAERRLVAAALAGAIVGVVTAERVAELNRVGLRQALDRERLAERKEALGTATGLDVVRAKQDVESARSSLISGDESLRQAREALGLVVGYPEQVGVPPSIDLAALERSAAGMCSPARGVGDRADVLAASAKAAVAKRNVDAVAYQYLPNLNVQSGLSASTTSAFGPPVTTWNIQAVLSLPIWDGGARYGARRVATAVLAEAEESLEATRRNVTIEATQAHRAVEVAATSRDTSARARDLAAEVDRLTQINFRVGAGTSLDLITAAVSLRQAEISLALQEFGLARTRIQELLTLARCPW